MFNVILGEKAIDGRLRHFPTWISSRNLANEPWDEAVQALIEAVTGRYDVRALLPRQEKAPWGWRPTRVGPLRAHRRGRPGFELGGGQRPRPVLVPPVLNAGSR